MDVLVWFLYWKKAEFTFAKSFYGEKILRRKVAVAQPFQIKYYVAQIAESEVTDVTFKSSVMYP